MKKIIAVFLTLIILISNISVLAGDVPEGLLHSFYARLYFAKVNVLVAGENDSHIDYCIEADATKVIKGNIPAIETYTNVSPVGDFTIESGKEYLISYSDEHNPAYVFETTTNDTKTLKIKHTSGDMWKRLEKYLNDGEFEKAEKKRREAAKSRTLAELLEAREILTDKSHFTYQNGSDGKEINIEKSELFELLNGISCSQIPATINAGQNGFHITTVSSGKTRALYISEGGLVSRNNKPTMSIAESAEYKISAEDMERLCAIAGIKPSYIVTVKKYAPLSALIILFIIAGTIITIKRRK